MIRGRNEKDIDREKLSWVRKQEDPRRGIHAMRMSAQGLPTLHFPVLDGLTGIRHCFTTRLGGVSEGIYASLNLRNGAEDPRENVLENYRRVAESLGMTPDRFVLTMQTHTTNVRVAGEEDAGKARTKPMDYRDVDGLVTDQPNLILSVFTADCVPLFFVDPVHRAIGVAHSGWRGTAGRIGRVLVETMAREYGSCPRDLTAAIGPSICRDCYEVSSDVADVFAAEFAGQEGEILTDKGGGKYQLDLWEANRIVMLEAGIPKDHIGVTDLCTCCNPDLLFSHRASQGRRGVLGGFLMLEEEEI